eukprot:GHVL01039546.1.p1 GENE.GHVL01039546.1~~GHVL01039546.1.p1  ORF type:complete len:822 (-),score=220.23 GHVL01039546.1:213-2678(-)
MFYKFNVFLYFQCMCFGFTTKLIFVGANRRPIIATWFAANNNNSKVQKKRFNLNVDDRIAENFLDDDYDINRCSLLSKKFIECNDIYEGDLMKIKSDNLCVYSKVYIGPDDMNINDIILGSYIKKNLKIIKNCNIIMRYINKPKIATRIYISPYIDSIKKLSFEKINDIIYNYFNNRIVPICLNEHIGIKYMNYIIECKIVRIDNETGFLDHAVVDDATERNVLEPISRLHDDLHTKVKISEIGGYEEELSKLHRLAVIPLQRPELFKNLGLPPPKGIIIHGASGCGKSLIAKSVCSDSNIYFEILSASSLIGRTCLETENNIKNLFRRSQLESPSIICIDDFDDVCKVQNNNYTGPGGINFITQLITILEDMSPVSLVTVLVLVNRINNIDSKLRSYGRFDQDIHIGIPDMNCREKILLIKTINTKLNKDVNLKKISNNTHGFVGADLTQLVMEAGLLAMEEKLNISDMDMMKRLKINKDMMKRLKINKDTDNKDIYNNKYIDNNKDVENIIDEKDDIVICNKHFEAALKTVNPTALREKVVEIPNVSWADVGGLEEVKQELIETVQYPVEYGHLYEKFGMAPSKGVLFYGPPGCGKTLLAKAVANECRANFISVKGPELLTMWFGESEANVRDLFDKARSAAPCIIFFDELDSIGKARSSTAQGSESGDRVINQILTEIDGITERKNVFIIGATNRPDILDPALTRPGRLDQLLYIPLPDQMSRLSVLKASLRKSPVHDDVDLHQIATDTKGYSGADLTEICQRAAKFAIKESISRMIEENPVPFIYARHFAEAMKTARKSVSDAELQRYLDYRKQKKT